MRGEFRKEEELQDGPPAGGHRERFLQRLQQEEQKQKGKIRFMPWLISLAAVAAAVVAIALVYSPNPVDSEHTAHAVFNPYEHIDTQTGKLEVVFAKHVKPQLEIIGKRVPELHEQIILLEKLETEYVKLKGLLKQTNEQQKITSEMIRNHRMRLKIMDNLLMQLQITNDKTPSNDENNSI